MMPLRVGRNPKALGSWDSQSSGISTVLKAYIREDEAQDGQQDSGPSFLAAMSSNQQKIILLAYISQITTN